MKITEADVELYRSLQKSPILFIEKTWGITPQRENEKFVKGKHLTWQQHDILLAVEKAIIGHGSGRISVRSGHGVGKALDINDIVPTPNGFKSVGDICAGDYLFGDNGNHVKVLGVKDWGMVPFYRVTFDDKSFVDVSSGHLWKVKNRQNRRTSGGWDVLSTEDIVSSGVKRSNGVGEARQWEIPVHKPVIYNDKENEKELKVDPYTYGVWLGDGDKRGSRITNIDNDVWDNIPYKVSADRNGCRTVYGLVTRLKSSGLFGCTNYNASVDIRYKESNHRLAVLQGLLDTDGWVEKSGGAAFSSASRQLVRDVIDISRSLGLKARTEKFKKNDHAGSWQTHITWNGEVRLFRVERKQIRLICAEDRYQKRWIDSIEKIGDRHGVCYEVEGGLFLTKDFHVTHNSATLSWLLLWYLFCYKDAQIPCTAPTADQMYDVLWKEVAKWHKKMPEWMQNKYEVTSNYVRITESPETWFARAKTARKENPEALAGVHGDFVMMLVDEASGVPEEIFNTAEGAMTGENVLIIMISNPTRVIGYFYDSHHKDKHNWQTFEFSSLDSPIVDRGYVQRIIDKHGEDSDEYKIRVLGEFPSTDMLDDSGYIPLLDENDLIFANEEEFVGERMLGVDVAGEGSNKTVWVLRDAYQAKVIASELVSSPKSVAQKTLTLMDRYSVKDRYVFVDGFGVGAATVTELALAGHRVQSVNVGDKPVDVERYINKRAELFWLMREWLITGGKLIGIDKWDDLRVIRYRRELSGKMKIKGKREMVRDGIQSPDVADALMLTFAKKTPSILAAMQDNLQGNMSFDRYSAI